METNALDPAPSRAASTGLWNRDFLNLWQGQFVSACGDVVYSVALGFWILERTGSSALMGTLIAVSSLPRIVVSPFAGVWVDRSDRRTLLIAADLIRGVAVVGVGLLALAGRLSIPAVFGAGVLIGLCGAFFSPALSSSLPDLVPRDRLVQANSVFGMIQTSTGIIGNAGGGFLYQAIGAPLLFVANGVSYLFSSLMLAFTRIPPIVRTTSRASFFAELGAGFRFVWRWAGLRALFLVASVLNFFASIGGILLLPLFQRSERLGPGRYGVAMACLTAGMLGGLVLTSALRVRPALRFRVFLLCGLVLAAMFGIVPFVSFPVLIAAVVIAGVTNAVANTLIASTVQLAVPQEMRGKAFALMGALSMGLTPIAMALGGVLGDILPIPLVIGGAFAAVFVSFAASAASGDLRRFVCTDPDAEPGGAAGTTGSAATG